MNESKTKAISNIVVALILALSVIISCFIGVKAMVATISSKPLEVYDAIFDSFTTNDTHGINEDDYITIGDCRLKVSMKDGIVTYYIRENN